jgi:ankyrin repeat protein
VKTNTEKAEIQNVSVLIDFVCHRANNRPYHPKLFIEAMEWASKHGYEGEFGKLNHFLNQVDLDGCIDFFIPFVIKHWTNPAKLIKELLTDPRIDPSANDQKAIIEACENGDLNLLKVLLDDNRVSPATSNQLPIKRACKQGNLDMVKLLLANPQVDPRADSQYCFVVACERGYIDIVNLLLKDKRIDPTAFKYNAFFSAAIAGRTDIMKILMADRTLQLPNDLLTTVCMFEKPEMVKMLLEDKRIDPSHKNSTALRESCERGDTESLKALLIDKRSNPNHGLPIITKLHFRHGNLEVAKLLLTDDRVDMSTVQSPESDQVLLLFLLRRSYRNKVIQGDDYKNNKPVTKSITSINEVESKRKALLDTHLLSDLSTICLDYVPDLCITFDIPIYQVLVCDEKYEIPRVDFKFEWISTI